MLPTLLSRTGEQPCSPRAAIEWIAELARKQKAAGEGGARVMPIRSYLEGQFFDPELIETMSQALADACTTLGVKDKDDVALRLLALRIIAAARDRVHDRALLKAAALKGLGPALKH